MPAAAGTLAVDGKTVRGSADGRGSPIHLVSAFATECRLVLVQQKADDKNNEITAIPELLDALLIRGSLVSIDAMGWQSEIAAKILEKKACWPSKATSPLCRRLCTTPSIPRSPTAALSGRVSG